jgi:putative nucleotidyltransferase with HDIG domain
MHKERCLEDLRIAYIGVVEILSKYLESADRYTKGHSIRVANCATEIAIAMELPRLQIENIKAAALLHDIGKVEVSMNLIKKASILSDEEKKIVDTHADKGAKILNSVGSVLKEAVPIVLCHHIRYEQMEVEGSPFLSAETKMGACIVAVADAYDAITSDRPYRAGKTPLQAMEEIERAAGKQFHPEVVEAFRRIFGVLTAEREDEGVALTI